LVLSIVITLLAVVKFPLVDGSEDTNPKAPGCSTVAEQLHPPPAAAVQLTEA
jgi:hypothetical protein